MIEHRAPFYEQCCYFSPSILVRSFEASVHVMRSQMDKIL